MQRVRWAALAVSVACTGFVGSMTLLVGDGSAPVAAALPPQITLAALRTDQLPRPARALKADRLPAPAVAARRLMDDARGADVRVAALGYSALPETGAGPIFSRVLGSDAGGTLQPLDMDEEHDEGDDEGDAMALAVPPVKPELPHREIVPLPPAKPLVPQASAARASLVNLSSARTDEARPQPARSFFASLGAGGVSKSDAAPDAPSRPGITVPTPFGVPYVLQTEKVEAACLKPELVSILRKIEAHYGEKVVITSGGRSRGRDGSLHKTCSAADIIVPHVDAESLARWVRGGVPEVGGVGTYCHPSMIHVDIGAPRDWKYGCGRSYFAMRDGSKTRVAITE